MEKLIISQSQKSRDLENIYSLYDELANIVNACRTISERYKYPEFSHLCDNAIELSGDFSKIANFVLNPESENLFDSVLEKESFFNNKILKSTL